jgi:hypothetical protein
VGVIIHAPAGEHGFVIQYLITEYFGAQRFSALQTRYDVLMAQC